MRYSHLLKHFLLFLVFMLLCSCLGSQKPKQDAPRTIKVELTAGTKNLYFNSKVRPLHTIPILSKVDGFIAKMYFYYGITVAKDQLLFVISSPQSNTEFRTAMVDYMKSRLDYTNNKTQETEAEELKKLGLISENEYTSIKSQVFNSNLAFQQTKRHMLEELEKFNVPATFFVEQLDAQANLASADNTKPLKDVVDTIQIYAPISGVILTPEGSETKPLRVGSAVKQGDIVGQIGDKSGLAFTIEINEVNYNEVKPGQEAIITSDAFPNNTLKGTVVYKERQANSGSQEGISLYSAYITVPKITPLENKNVLIGMNVQVTLPVQTPPAIQVPLTAVYQKNGDYYVKIVDKKTRQDKEVKIQPGLTTMDSITVNSGLNSGDEVVINANPTN